MLWCVIEYASMSLGMETGVIGDLIIMAYSLILSLNSLDCQIEMLALLCVCIGWFELSQLSCLGSSIGRTSCIECVKCGFKSHLSAAWLQASNLANLRMGIGLPKFVYFIAGIKTPAICINCVCIYIVSGPAWLKQHLNSPSPVFLYPNSQLYLSLYTNSTDLKVGLLYTGGGFIPYFNTL